FAEIEACMDAHPDSALLLLGRIAHPERLHGKERADYALLLTRARDKNYLDSLQSDSLIQLAVDYYRDGTDRAKAGKAFFYAAKLQALQRNDSAAMQGYLEALRALEGTKEYRMQGLAHEYIGMLNDKRKLYDMALDNYRQALSYVGKCNDTLMMVYVCRDIAWTYEKKHESDSVCQYLQAAFHLLQGDTLSAVYPSLMQLLGEQKAAQGCYVEAVDCFRSAIRHERALSSTYHYYMSLGDVYLRMGQMELAEECFRKVLEADNPYTRAGGCHYFYRLERQRGNFDRAIRYKEQSDSLLEVSRSATEQSRLLTMQQNDERENQRLASAALLKRAEWQKYGIALLFVLFVGGAFFLYFRIKKRYRLQRDSGEKRHADELRRIARGYEQCIARHLCRIEEQERKEAQDSEDTRQQIEVFRQQIQILEDENRKIKEGKDINGLSVLVKLRQHLLLVQNMTPEEKHLLFEYMDLSFDGFVAHLGEEHGMKASTLLFVVLMKVGFSTDDLAFVFESELATIWKRKRRLKDKLGLNSKDSLELFLFYYPGKCLVK
ncbi:tetratricopeptide repeat protein, partial [Bacteroides sp.]|uniref:tetratricopeptide repeat protein n=1 Tax=Bacteroides sp. TaxID=29523 RepID=UPI0023C77F61